MRSPAALDAGAAFPAFIRCSRTSRNTSGRSRRSFCGWFRGFCGRFCRDLGSLGKFWKHRRQGDNGCIRIRRSIRIGRWRQRNRGSFGRLFRGFFRGGLFLGRFRRKRVRVRSRGKVDGNRGSGRRLGHRSRLAIFASLQGGQQIKRSIEVHHGGLVRKIRRRRARSP